MSFVTWSIADIAASVREGKRSARAITESFLARVEALDGRLGCFLRVDTAGALAALRVLEARPELSDLVRDRVRMLADALGVVTPDGAVLSLPMPSPQLAVAAQAAALDEGVRVGCFRPPSVPDGVSRLRITVNAGLADADWAHAVDVLSRVVKEHA